ncbi:uncharacterized protein LOC120340788 [Styela clava]
MIINKRMMRRNGATIFLVLFGVLLLFMRYRIQLQDTFRSLRGKSEKENAAIEKLFGPRKIISKEPKIISTNKIEDIEIKKEEKIEKPPLKLENAQNWKVTDEICELNPFSEVFKNSDDGYETMKMSNEEIHSEKFTHATSTIKPVFEKTTIRLNPDRFLFPILMRGPNNQLIGFRESIYVAIRLNRTLVIPRFIKHRTDSQREEGSTTIHPAHRVDFVTLCSFISCVTMQQFRTACGNQADVILRLRHYSKKRIPEMESLTGVRFSYSNNPKEPKLNLVPKEPENKATTYFGHKEKEIQAIFNSKGRCAIYALPYYNMKIRLKASPTHIRTQADLHSMSDTDVFSEIIRHTPAPKYLRSVAEDFIKTKFGGAKFLTVHWRYDKKDWMKRCGELQAGSSRKKLCNEAALIQPPDVAQAVLLKLDDVKFTVPGITHIYIASPPSEIEFITEVKKILNEKKFLVYHIPDLTSFLKERYASCNFIKEHLDDIESSIEMQICTRGSVFLRSTRSSWSSNVIEWRRHNLTPSIHADKDEDVFQLTRKIMEKNQQNKV